MKKLLLRAALGIGTLGVVAAGAAAFSAFEAHVINVTATIENALSVPIEARGLSYGTVFPQEVFDQTFDVGFSNSFLAQSRVDEVDYQIRQKPKCGLPVPNTNPTDPVTYSGFAQVTEDATGNFVCPNGYAQLPLLCPYLSKHETTTDNPELDTGINSFHGLPGPWTPNTTIATQVVGVLNRLTNDTSDTWNIDLRTPCFSGQCDQGWAGFVTHENPTANPNDYVAATANEHQMWGCDLWLEATKIATSAP